MNNKTQVIKISEKAINYFEQAIEAGVFEGGNTGFLIVNSKVEDVVKNISTSEILRLIIENPYLLESELDDEFFQDEYLFENKENIQVNDVIKSHIKPIILGEVMEYLSKKGFYKKNNDGIIKID